MASNGLWEISQSQAALSGRLHMDLAQLPKPERTIAAAQTIIEQWVNEQITSDKWHGGGIQQAIEYEEYGLAFIWPAQTIVVGTELTK